ncbi:MAG TPA: prephenate dehydrogenase/arogenate dehydrogenase family protein [Candidatus Dormibacteraeota bacterium]
MRRVAIVGLGLIGGSLGLGLKRYLPGVAVMGVARRRESADEAVAMGAVDAAGTDLSALAEADLVVLACPLAVTAAVLEDAIPHLAEGARVTDVGSTKSVVVEHAVRALDQARNPFLGGHPMAGKEASGIGHADPDLFRGRPWVFTPHVVGAAEPFEDFLNAVRAIGAVPLNLAPDQHDRYVALVSHVPFLLSAAYLLSVGRDPDWADAAELASSGFRDISRLGAGNSEMYAAITSFNREEVLRAWQSLHQALDMFEAAMARGEDPMLLDLLVTARAIRDGWAADHPEPG